MTREDDSDVRMQRLKYLVTSVALSPARIGKTEHAVILLVDRRRELVFAGFSSTTDSIPCTNWNNRKADSYDSKENLPAKINPQAGS